MLLTTLSHKVQDSGKHTGIQVIYINLLEPSTYQMKIFQNGCIQSKPCANGCQVKHHNMKIANAPSEDQRLPTWLLSNLFTLRCSTMWFRQMCYIQTGPNKYLVHVCIQNLSCLHHIQSAMLYNYTIWHTIKYAKCTHHIFFRMPFYKIALMYKHQY